MIACFCKIAILAMRDSPRFHASPELSGTPAQFENGTAHKTSDRTLGEVTSQNLWSRYERHFVGITRYNALS